jgi:hypothetical protein
VEIEFEFLGVDPTGTQGEQRVAVRCPAWRVPR